MEFREEQDSMGIVRVPREALWGAQTQRAVDNFPISGRGLGRELIRALGLIKKTAALVNLELGLLPADLAKAIQQAAEEVVQGLHDAHFPVDMFQTGSGTSSNMNANEVIANRAIEISGGVRGSKNIHPNDHVNLGQSSNDVIPSAIHIAALELVEQRLLPALVECIGTLSDRQEAFFGIVKTGRTHLQDATPIRLDQEFSAFVAQIEAGRAHLADTAEHLRDLALGGTAVGTGINTHPEFGRRMAERLSRATGIVFREAKNHFAAQASRDACMQVSGALKALATSLYKIANDIRWLGSGPRLGLGELILPEVQPGSSIMPGKVNPVMAEALIMVCCQVIANDSAICLGGMGGNFQLNAMLPLIAVNLLDQVRLLANGLHAFSGRLLKGLEANRAALQEQLETSLAMATLLVPVLGYDEAARIAKRAHESGQTIRQVALLEGHLDEKTLDQLLDPARLTGPSE